ncbi:hypothetical protein ACQKTA_09090 [Enterococcus sp. 22-H-5-01]|uniref:hypothetical protein n=1 Tax=Enterococcus sp. 22-H-5-01 TaxID=3418555 RepID=UPI003D07C95B
MRKCLVLIGDLKVVTKLAPKDFNNLKYCFNSFHDFEDIYNLKRLVDRTFNDYQNYISQALDNSDLELTDFYFEALDRALKYIFYARMCFENIGEKDTGLKEVFSSLDQTNTTYRMLRLMRNYAQHHSLPLKSAVEKWKYSDERLTISKEIFISKEDFLRKRLKKLDCQFIEKNYEEKIYIDDLFVEIQGLVEKYYVMAFKNQYNKVRLQIIAVVPRYKLELFSRILKIDKVGVAKIIRKGQYAQEKFHPVDRGMLEKFLEYAQEKKDI